MILIFAVMVISWMVMKMTKCSPENCKTCKHHDVFWKHSGCILKNGMEKPRYKKKKDGDEHDTD